MDEISDVSRAEEASLCLSYVISGETKETFLTARPWAERGSCSARGFFFFVFVSPDADLRG